MRLGPEEFGNNHRKSAEPGSGEAGPDLRRGVALGALALSFAVCLLAPAAKTMFPERFEAAAAGVGMPFPESGANELSDGVGMVGVVNEPLEYREAKPLGFQPYTVSKGETVSGIAQQFGLTQDTILSVNRIKNSRLVQIGQVLSIPNQDGILYDIKKGDTLAGLAEKYEIDIDGIKTANGFAEDALKAGERIFLPEARLGRVDLQEINGDLFKWPVRGYVSSRYGWRTSPFTGAKQFHSGLDIAAPHGTPLRAAMAGKVTATGYDVNSGNYVVIAHHSGYRTFYGHLDVIRVKAGDYVKEGQRIGDVGSTGLSTGSHCHFTVFKNGATVNPINLVN